MLRFAVDENFNNNIIRGLIRRNSHIDIVRIQDVGLSGADDPTVLEWAASQGRILLTHDVATITYYAYERIKADQRMPGVFEASISSPIGQIIEDILLLIDLSFENEWEGKIAFLPLK
ncbi:MAG: DUF5615 family PIN-like protein [Acidobacteria bacterium]|jgi:hypothetical protein|nr:DUF5615 family PIN-like protein [Acidobacteriota bacterium]